MSVLGTQGETQLHAVTMLAKSIFGVRFAGFSLTPQLREDLQSLPHGSAFESLTQNAFAARVFKNGAALVVPDAQLDDDFKADALVTGSSVIRFYAGAPIRAANVVIGAIELADTSPRDFDGRAREQLDALADLAGSILAPLAQEAGAEPMATHSGPNTGGAEGSGAGKPAVVDHPFLELIMANIPDMIFVKDDQFRIVQANTNFLNVYPEEVRSSVIGTTTLEQYNEAERTEFLKHDQKALDVGFSETEETIDFPDGARRTLLTRKVRFEDESGDKFLLGVGKDITELVRARRENEAAIELLNTVFDTVTGAVIGLNADKQILMINNAGRHMLAGAMEETPFAWPDEVIFLDREDLHPLESSHDPIARALIGQKIVGEVHLMTRRSAPDNRYVRVTSALVKSKSSALHTVIVLDDVSESERNRQQIERQSRLDALGQLTGGIAHDFNNLLNTTQYAIELICRDNLNERSKRSAAAVMKSIARGSELTNRLLAFAKKQPSRAAARPLTEAFAELKELVGPAIEAAITVEFLAAEECLMVYCDQGQLQNAVLNLILNSRDAIMQSSVGHTITVGARAVDALPPENDEQSYQEAIAASELTGSEAAKSAAVSGAGARAGRGAGAPAHRYIEIYVSDDGPGMSKEVAARALDPFFTTKDVNSGTGLGLSMVYGFIQQSDGDLRIYSEEGVGTTVKFYLPRGDKASGIESPVALASPLLGDGETILVVEDEEFLRQQLVEFLKELNYKTLEASSGRAAIEMIEAGARADLLLTDVVMPGGVGGFELARLARAIIPDLPIIYMSGYTGFTDEEMGEVVAPLLPKPSSPGATSVQIRAVLDGVKG